MFVHQRELPHAVFLLQRRVVLALLGLLAVLQERRQRVIVNCDLVKAVLDLADLAILVLVLRQAVPDIGPLVLRAQDHGLDLFAIRQQRYRDAARTLAVVVVVVLPGLRHFNLHRFRCTLVRDLDLVDVLFDLLQFAVDRHFIACHLRFFDRVIDRRAFLILRQAVPGVAPTVALVQDHLGCLGLCILRHRGQAGLVVIRLQRYGDAVRPLAVPVVLVVPRLHHRDLHGLGLMRVLDLDRVRSAAFLRLAQFADTDIVPFDLVLLEAVLDLLAVRVLRQTVLGVGPAIFLFDPDRLHKLSVRQQLHVDVVRTDAVLVVRVVPHLLDRDFHGFGRVAVLQVRDRADGLRRGCVLRYGLAILFDDQNRLVFHPRIFIFLRQALRHRRPVVLLAQGVLRLDRVARRVKQLSVFERHRLVVDNLHQGHGQFFRTEARAVVVVVPHLQHFQAEPVGVVGVRDGRHRDVVEHVGMDIRHRVVAVLADGFDPTVGLQIAIHIQRQVVHRQRPGVAVFLIGDAVIVAFIRQRDLIVTRNAHVVRQQGDHDLCIRALPGGVVVVVPNLDDHRGSGEQSVLILHHHYSRFFSVRRGQGHFFGIDSRPAVIAGHISHVFVFCDDVGAQRQIGPGDSFPGFDLYPVSVRAQILAVQAVVVAVFVRHGHEEDPVGDIVIFDFFPGSVIDGHRLGDAQLGADHVDDLECGLRHFIRGQEGHVFIAEEVRDRFRIGQRVGVAQLDLDFLHGVGDDVAFIIKHLQVLEGLRGTPLIVLKLQRQRIAVFIGHGFVADVQAEDHIVAFLSVRAVPNLDQRDFRLRQDVLEVRNIGAGVFIYRRNLDGFAFIIRRDIHTAHRRGGFHDAVQDFCLDHKTIAVQAQVILGQILPAGLPLAILIRRGNGLRIRAVDFCICLHSCPVFAVQTAFQRECNGSVPNAAVDAGIRLVCVSAGLVPVLVSIDRHQFRFILVLEFDRVLQFQIVVRPDGHDQEVFYLFIVPTNLNHNLLRVVFVIGQAGDFQRCVFCNGVCILARFAEFERTEHTPLTGGERQRVNAFDFVAILIGQREDELAGILGGALSHGLFDRDLHLDLAVGQLGQNHQGRLDIVTGCAVREIVRLNDFLFANRPAVDHITDLRLGTVALQLDPLVLVALAVFIHLFHKDCDRRPVVVTVKRSGIDRVRFPIDFNRLRCRQQTAVQRHIQGQILIHIRLAVHQPLLGHSHAELAGLVGVDQVCFRDLVIFIRAFLAAVARERFMFAHRYSVDDPAQRGIQPRHRAHVGVRLHALADRFALRRDLVHGVHAYRQILHLDRRVGVDHEDKRFVVILSQPAVLIIGHVQGRAVDLRGYHGVIDLAGIVLSLVLAIHEHALADLQFTGLQRVGDLDLPDLIVLIVSELAIGGGIAVHSGLGHGISDLLALLLHGQVRPFDRQGVIRGVRRDGLGGIRDIYLMNHTVHRVSATQSQVNILPQRGVIVVIIPNLGGLHHCGFRHMRIGDLTVVGLIIQDQFDIRVIRFILIDRVFIGAVYDRYFRVCVCELRQAGPGHGVCAIAIVGYGLFRVGHFTAVRVQVHLLRVLFGSETQAVLVVRVVPDLGDFHLDRGLVAVGHDGAVDDFAIILKFTVRLVRHGIGCAVQDDLAVHFIQFDDAVADLMTVHILGQFLPAVNFIFENAGLVAALDVHGNHIAFIVSVAADQAQGDVRALAGVVVMVLPDLLHVNVDGFGAVGVLDLEGEGAVFVLHRCDGHGVGFFRRIFAHRDLVAVFVLLTGNDFLHGVRILLHLGVLALSPVVVFVQIGPGIGPAVLLAQGNRVALGFLVLIQLHADFGPQAILVVIVLPELGHGDFGLGRVLVFDLPDAVRPDFGIQGVVSYVVRRRAYLDIGVVQFDRHVLLDGVFDLDTTIAVFIEFVLGQFSEDVAPRYTGNVLVFLCEHLFRNRLLARVQDHSHALRTLVFGIVEVIPQLDHRHIHRLRRVRVLDDVLPAAARDTHGVDVFFIVGSHHDDAAVIVVFFFVHDLLDTVFQISVQAFPDMRPVIAVVQGYGISFYRRIGRIAALFFRRSDNVQLHLNLRPLAIHVVPVVPDLLNGDAGGVRRVIVGDGHSGDRDFIRHIRCADIHNFVSGIHADHFPTIGQLRFLPAVGHGRAVDVFGHSEHITQPVSVLIGLIGRERYNAVGAHLGVGGAIGQQGHIQALHRRIFTGPDLLDLDIDHLARVIIADVELRRRRGIQAVISPNINFFRGFLANLDFRLAVITGHIGDAYLGFSVFFFHVVGALRQVLPQQFLAVLDHQPMRRITGCLAVQGEVCLLFFALAVHSHQEDLVLDLGFLRDIFPVLGDSDRLDHFQFAGLVGVLYLQGFLSVVSDARDEFIGIIIIRIRSNGHDYFMFNGFTIIVHIIGHAVGFALGLGDDVPIFTRFGIGDLTEDAGLTRLDGDYVVIVRHRNVCLFDYCSIHPYPELSLQLELEFLIRVIARRVDVARDFLGHLGLRSYDLVGVGDCQFFFVIFTIGHHRRQRAGVCVRFDLDLHGLSFGVVGHAGGVARGLGDGVMVFARFGVGDLTEDAGLARLDGDFGVIGGHGRIALSRQREGESFIRVIARRVDVALDFLGHLGLRRDDGVGVGDGQFFFVIFTIGHRRRQRAGVFVRFDLDLHGLSFGVVGHAGGVARGLGDGVMVFARFGVGDLTEDAGLARLDGDFGVIGGHGRIALSRQREGESFIRVIARRVDVALDFLGHLGLRRDDGVGVGDGQAVRTVILHRRRQDAFFIRYHRHSHVLGDCVIGHAGGAARGLGDGVLIFARFGVGDLAEDAGLARLDGDFGVIGGHGRAVHSLQLELEFLIRVIARRVGVTLDFLGHIGLCRSLGVAQRGHVNQLRLIGLARVDRHISELGVNLGPAIDRSFHPLVFVPDAIFVHLVYEGHHVGPVVALVQFNVDLAIDVSPRILGLACGCNQPALQGHFHAQAIVHIGLAIHQPLLGHSHAELAGHVGVNQGGFCFAALLDSATVLRAGQVKQILHGAHVGIRLVGDGAAVRIDFGHGVFAHRQASDLQCSAGLDFKDLGFCVSLAHVAAVAGHIVGHAVDDALHLHIEGLCGVVAGLVFAVHEHALADFQFTGLQRVGDINLPNVVVLVVFEFAICGFIAVHSGLGHGISDLLALLLHGQVSPGHRQGVARGIRRDGLFGVVNIYIVCNVIDRVDAAQGQGDLLAQIGVILVTLPDLGRLDGLGFGDVGVGYRQTILICSIGNLIDRTILTGDSPLGIAGLRIGCRNGALFFHSISIGCHRAFTGFRISTPVILVQIGPGVGPVLGLGQLNRAALGFLVLIQLHADFGPQAILVVIVVPDLGHGDFGLGRVLVGDLPRIAFRRRRLRGAVCLLIVLVQLNRHELLDRIFDLLSSRSGWRHYGLIFGQILENVTPGLTDGIINIRFFEYLLIHRFLACVQDDPDLIRPLAFGIIEVIPQLDHGYFDGARFVAVGHGEASFVIAGDRHCILSAVEGDLVTGNGRAVFVLHLGHGIGDFLAVASFFVQIGPDIRPAVIFIQRLDSGDRLGQGILSNLFRLVFAYCLISAGQLDIDHCRPLAVLVAVIVPGFHNLDAGLARCVGVRQGGHLAINGGIRQAVAFEQLRLIFIPGIDDFRTLCVEFGQAADRGSPIAFLGQRYFADIIPVLILRGLRIRQQDNGQGCGPMTLGVIIVLPDLDDRRFGQILFIDILDGNRDRRFALDDRCFSWI